MTRLPPIPYEEWSEDAKEVLPRYLRRPELFRPGSPDSLPMPNAMGMLANHVPLGGAWLAFNAVLANDVTVDLRLRELVILRVAWRTRSAYEWTQHVRIGHHAGISVEQLHAIPEGPDAGVWTPVERDVLTATDELIDDHRVGDATWGRLAERFASSELLELVFVAGAYLCFALVCNSADLRPDPPTEVIDAPMLPGMEAW